jgi:hypothetical protein
MVVRHFAGLDVGQPCDYTALAVLERSDMPECGYAVRHLQRWPPGTAYPAVVEDVAARLRALPTAPLLAVDITAVGNPVLRLLGKVDLPGRVWAVTLTAGSGAVGTPDGLHVPKKELVSTLQVLL